MIDWDEIWMNGCVTKHDKGWKDEVKFRRNIAWKGKIYIYARVVWNVMHPEDLAKRNEHVHHKDLDPMNDCPENLVKLSPKEHAKFHPPPPRTTEHRKQLREGLKRRWESMSSNERKEIANTSRACANKMWKDIKSGKRKWEHSRLKFNAREAVQLKIKGLTNKRIAELLKTTTMSVCRFFSYHGLSQKIEDGSVLEWINNYEKSYNLYEKVSSEEIAAILAGEVRDARVACLPDEAVEFIVAQIKKGFSCFEVSGQLQEKFPELPAISPKKIEYWKRLNPERVVLDMACVSCLHYVKRRNKEGLLHGCKHPENRGMARERPVECEWHEW